MTDRKPKNKDSKRRGVWEEIQTLEDPDSKVGLIISEKIRGKPSYSFQIVHFDDIGPNKFVPNNPPNAKYKLADIVRSLIESAEEIVDERKKKAETKSA